MISKTSYLPHKQRLRKQTPFHTASHQNELLSWWADIMGNTPIGAAVIDLDNRAIRSLNPAFAAMHGLSVEALNNQSLVEVLAPESYRQTFYAIRQAALQGYVAFNNLHQRNDGSYFDVHADMTVSTHHKHTLLYRVTPIAPDHKPSHFKQDPASLLEVLENVEDTVMVTDLKGDIVYVNPFFEKTSGYSADEVFGKNPRLLKSDYQGPGFYKSLWDTLLAGDTWRGSLINRRKDGAIYQEAATIFPVHDSQGQVLNYAAIKRDVTDHVQQESEMEAISTLSTALRIAYSRDQMFPVVLGQIMSLMKVRAACLAMSDPVTGGISIDQTTGDLNFDDSLYASIIQDFSADIVKSGQLFYTGEIGGQATAMPGNLRPHSSLVLAGMPLIAQEETLGVLWVARNHEITQNEFRLLSLLANIVAIAISRDKLHHQTLRFAKALSEAYEETIEGWARALEIRDKETEGHARRVADLTLELSRQLGLTDGDLINIRRGALLHDIGKMAIPDNVLLKPGPLNEDEWKIMRRHPSIAKELLSPIAELKPALDIPYYHHEKYDGSGYPQGLKQNDIPLAARIFSVVDVWDALCSDRPYRNAWPEESVKTYIHEQAGKAFDPHVVDVFLHIIQDRPHELLTQPASIAA